MSESKFVRHVPCEKCGSSDNAALYDDGHTFCFGCEHHVNAATDDLQPIVVESKSVSLIEGTAGSLSARGISQQTCEKYGYLKAMIGGKPVQLACYADASGHIVAQKARFADKTFTWVGAPKEVVLFGQHLWSSGGKMVVVTEGEIDALSVAQMHECRWPVVSVPNGAAGAAKALKKSLEWLEGFERVVLMFDMDDAGKKAALECAEIFTPGKCAIANLPMKDANELLKAGRGAEIISSMWNAKIYRPDGILGGDEVKEMLISRRKAFTLGTYPHAGLQSMTRGIRSREIVTICAGSGIGKTEFTRFVAYSLNRQGLKCGYIALEESVDRTALGLVSLHLGQRLHLMEQPEKWPGFDEAWSDVITEKVFFYDHFGSLDGDNLLNKIRYLRTSIGVDFVVLDHLSIVVSGLDDGDERKTIDKVMTQLRSLSEDTGVAVMLVSHLKRPDGKAHEEGANTSLAQLRGSAAIGQLSDIVIGLERNQQDDETKNITTVRILKNRWTGETGIAGHMSFDRITGTMQEETIAPPSDFSED